MGAQRQPGDDTEGPAAAALEGPEQLPVPDRVGDAHGPVCGDDLRLQQVRRGGAEPLGEAAEPTAQHQARDPDGGAAPALHIATRRGGDSIIDVHPDRAGAHAHRRLGLDQAGGAPGHKPVVELDGPQVGPGPDEQRIRGVRAPDITVTAPFHDQADPVVASEVHRGRDIGAALGQHRVRAGLRGPGIGPAEGLGQATLSPM